MNNCEKDLDLYISRQNKYLPEPALKFVEIFFTFDFALKKEILNNFIALLNKTNPLGISGTLQIAVGGCVLEFVYFLIHTFSWFDI
jgi:hypothetical protein